jgi:hypothetical protein
MEPDYSRLPSPISREFVAGLLQKNYKERFNANQALEHRWLYTETSTVCNKEALKNLRKFQASEMLKQATFTYMASQLVSKDEKDKIAAMFRPMDRDGSGTLDRREIQAGYE